MIRTKKKQRVFKITKVRRHVLQGGVVAFEYRFKEVRGGK